MKIMNMIVRTPVIIDCNSHSNRSNDCNYNTVGFHNFNLRIFNLRVSNPDELIVDVFFDTMSDFNVPGSRPQQKHDEIVKTDRRTRIVSKYNITSYIMYSSNYNICIYIYIYISIERERY